MEIKSRNILPLGEYSYEALSIELSFVNSKIALQENEIIRVQKVGSSNGNIALQDDFK